MKNNKVRDERVISATRKIQSDGFQILVLILMVSTLFQQIFLQAPFSQYAVEFFCWIGCGLYILVRHFIMGIDIWGSEQRSNKMILKSVLFSGMLSVLLLVFLYGENSTNNLLIFFVCFIAFNFLFQYFIRYINRKKQKQITVTMSKNEMDE